MPFGAAIGNDGEITFSLWAPAAGGVDVRLLTQGGGERALPLERRDAGWFAISGFLVRLSSCNSTERLRT